MPTPLTLAEPSTAQLDPAPLELVVCQVRHESRVEAADVRTALAIRDEVRDYPEINQQEAQEIEVVGGPGQRPMASSTEINGWKLMSSEGDWTVVLQPTFFALECTGYTSWRDFRRRFEALTAAVEKHIEPRLVQRLGLRYIDRLRMPDSGDPRDWRNTINEHLLGPLLDERLGASVQQAQQILQLLGPNDSQVLLRHGAEEKSKEGWTYVLDTDCFRTDSQRFGADSLVEQAGDLHELSLQVFQVAVTKSHRDRLTRQEDAPRQGGS